LHQDILYLELWGKYILHKYEISIHVGLIDQLAAEEVYAQALQHSNQGHPVIRYHVADMENYLFRLQIREMDVQELSKDDGLEDARCEDTEAREDVIRTIDPEVGSSDGRETHHGQEKNQVEALESLTDLTSGIEDYSLQDESDSPLDGKGNQRRI
jgi:hypothetical protein